MALYLLAIDEGGDDAAVDREQLDEALTVDYDARRALGNGWFVASEKDVEALSEELAELCGPVQRVLLLEVSGDLALEGADDETAEWLRERMDEETGE